MDNNLNEKLIIEYIEEALKKLYENDSYLISFSCDDLHNAEEAHVSERAIVHRFAIYFEQVFVRSHGRCEYDFDVEYNRNIKDIKRVYDKLSIPDLIVHKRGCEEKNLAVFEFKTWWSGKRLIVCDHKKVKKIMKELKYKHGFVIKVDKKETSITYYCSAESDEITFIYNFGDNSLSVRQ